MATSKTPEPSAPLIKMTPSAIADSGADLIRLWVAAFTLPVTAANAVGTVFSRFITNVTSALDGNPVPQSNNEIVRATSDVVKATTGLYTSLLNTAISTLESTTRAINAAAADNSTAPRK